MHVREAMESRRSFRALEKSAISLETIRDLAIHACLAPSCFNKQPWRFVFITDPEILSRFREILNKGNAWTQNASALIAVCSQKELDCMVNGREYFLFDSGMAAAFLMLRAQELGIESHAMAGFDEAKAKQALAVPEPMTVITLIALGKHAGNFEKILSGWQLEAEKTRPSRLPLSDFAFSDQYGNPIPDNGIPNNRE